MSPRPYEYRPPRRSRISSRIGEGALTLSIDPALFERYPALRVGAFLATHLDRAKVPAITVRSTIAARHRMPIIGCDVDSLPVSTVTIRMARPATDWFLPLGARPTDI